MMVSRCHKQRLDMTKTELQVTLAAATETNKRIAGVFLDTLSTLAYKAIKKNGEFVLPGFGKLVKQKRKGSRRLQSEDAAEDQNSGQDRRQVPSCQGGEGRGSGGKEVVSHG
jgi:nucleoid DNA-binding protein